MDCTKYLLLVIVATVAVTAGCLWGNAPLAVPGSPPAPHNGTPGALPGEDQSEKLTVPPERETGPLSPAPFVPGTTYPAGSRIRLSGPTILSPGNHILVEVRSVSFFPTGKSQSLPVSGTAGIATVEKSDGTAFNSWSYEWDTERWEPGEYLVQVRGMEVPAFSLDTRFFLAP
ncbi:MAG: hypothetical protein NQU46_05080 [Methanolinea sp.]|nr:hypothetical protein [Methanolinea sp.]